MRLNCEAMHPHCIPIDKHRFGNTHPPPVYTVEYVAQEAHVADLHPHDCPVAPANRIVVDEQNAKKGEKSVTIAAQQNYLCR